MDNKQNLKNIGIAATIATVGAAILFAVNAISGNINKTFSPLTPNGVWLQAANPPVERAVNNGNYWTLYVGSPASGVTHFMRVRFGMPEHLGVPSMTRFCLSERIRLPLDFYSKWNDGRIMGTDNYLGASSGNELRASIYVTADNRVRVRAEHQNNQNLDFYVSDVRPGYLEPGLWHNLTLCGNVGAVEGWYFMVDNVVIAQGVAMLAPASVPVNERIMSRAYCGPDGAYRLVLSTPLAIDLEYCTIRDFDPNGILQPAPASVTASFTASAGPVTPSATRTPTGSPVPTFTSTRTPTALPVPTQTPTATPATVPTVCEYSTHYMICTRP